MKTIRVNHPLTVNGITIYQSSYGDGGSDITLKSWHLGGFSQPAELKAVSQRQFPLDLGSAGQYKLEFGELRVFNVENLRDNDSLPENKMHEVRSVNQDKKIPKCGTNHHLQNPRQCRSSTRICELHAALATRRRTVLRHRRAQQCERPYRWLMIPADHNRKLDSFMAFRHTLLQPAERDKIVAMSVLNVNEATRPQFKMAVENLLRQFAEGGYLAINEHIKIPCQPPTSKKTGEFMYQILYGTMNVALDHALRQAGLPEMPAGEERNRFILNSLTATPP